MIRSTKLFIIFLWLLILCLPARRCLAQAVPDTSLTTILPDSLAEKRRAELAPRFEATPLLATPTARTLPFQPIPKKAALYSALLPGAGQFYNREYWKIGLIYAGIGVSGYFLVTNSADYTRYRKAYVARITDLNVQDEFTGRWSRDPVVTRTNLQTLQDASKRYLDLTILLSAVGYTLQVLDALTFAHLKNFDVSRDITLRMAPVTAPGGAGFGLVMHFK